MNTDRLVKEILYIPHNITIHPTREHVQKLIQAYIRQEHRNYSKSLNDMPEEIERILDFLGTVHLDPLSPIYVGIYEALVLERLEKLI